MVSLKFDAKVVRPEVAELPELPCEYDKLSWRQKFLVRQEYARRQGGLCRFCRTGLDGEPAASVLALPLKETNWQGSGPGFPPDFWKHPVHLHHNHINGLTIGAVHARCNAVLWQYHGE